MIIFYNSSFLKEYFNALPHMQDDKTQFRAKNRCKGTQIIRKFYKKMIKFASVFIEEFILNY